MASTRLMTAVAAVAALVIVAGVIVATSLPGGNGSPTCTKCFGTEPIVDIVSPVLGNATSSVNQNRTLDVQAGKSAVLEIDVYPTIPVNVTLEFSSVLVYSTSGTTSGSGALPSALFQPNTLSIKQNSKGVSSLTITVPELATRGTYDTVVSAVNNQNSTEVWGLYFQLVVK
jgi:hypothetical protein